MQETQGSLLNASYQGQKNGKAMSGVQNGVMKGRCCCNSPHQYSISSHSTLNTSLWQQQRSPFSQRKEFLTTVNTECIQITTLQCGKQFVHFLNVFSNFHVSESCTLGTMVPADVSFGALPTSFFPLPFRLAPDPMFINFVVWHSPHHYMMVSSTCFQTWKMSLNSTMSGLYVYNSLCGFVQGQIKLQSTIKLYKKAKWHQIA